MNAWPFLISRNRTLGFNLIVAPQFLEDQQLSLVLLEAAGGELTQPGQAIYREIHGTPGALSLIFRIIRAEQSLIGLDGSDLLRDKYGRPINLIEGIVLEGRNPDILVKENDMQFAHEQVIPAYKEFWKITKDIFTIQTSLPFNLNTNAKDTSLILITEPSYSLKKAIQKTSDEREHIGFLQAFLEFIRKLMSSEK